MTDFPRSILEFQQFFPDESTCISYLEAIRFPTGFICPRCGFRDAYRLPNRLLYQCKGCGYQLSITAGTAMHGTHTPICTWFWAAYFMTTHTPGISATQLSRQLNLRYETAFNILHKLRATMIRPEREPLYGIVEIDESYVGGHVTGKAGRGALGKAVIICAVEKRDSTAGRIRLSIIEDASSESLHEFIRLNVQPGTVIFTDGWAGYYGIEQYGYIHQVKPLKSPDQLLPLVHIVFGNLKSWLIGTHHGVSSKHLQAYLNEFTFRFNRRGNPMLSFNTILGLSIVNVSPTYEQLYCAGEEDEDECWKHPGALAGLDDE